VTSDFVGFVDQTTRAMLSPLDRMKKLLTAPDKRAMILEMVDKGASHLIAPTGPRTTASAWLTPILKDFSTRRLSPHMVPRFPSIPAIDAFQLQPTPFDSTPTLPLQTSST